MSRIRTLARPAIAGLCVLALQVGPAAAHDDGLTCHEHPALGWTISEAFISSWSLSPGVVRIRGLIRVRVDEAGNARIAANGSASVRGDVAHDWAVLTIDDAAMACSEVGMTRYDLAMVSPRTRERGSLAIVPIEPIREPGHHGVRFRLEYPGGVTEHDGAILVVSANEGAGP